MARIKYEEHAFYGDNEELLWWINNIIARYQKEGFVLTLRQLYYQLVSKNQLHNEPKAYTRLAGVVNKGRMAGRIDWEAIVDTTRGARRNIHYHDIGNAMESLADRYAIDTRATQEIYIEVWIEKDALIGIIGPVCRELDITFLSCRGFLSLSEIWSAAKYRLQPAIERGQFVVILHLADHDPSGISMTEDIHNRLSILLGWRSVSVRVKRIGLNLKQAQKLNLPPNPAKETDKRFPEYQKNFGDECWELDALEPKKIQRLIRHHVKRLTAIEKRQLLIQKQSAEKSKLDRISTRYTTR